MRCLIVVPSLIRAGAETQAVDLANGLAGLGHDVHMCSFQPQMDQRSRLVDEVRFHHVLRKGRYDRQLIQALSEIIDREQIEVAQGVLQYSALMVWRASARSGRRPPVVAAIHTTVNHGIKGELQDRLIYRPMLRRLPAVVFVCEHQKDHWLKKYPELKPIAHVVYNGIDVGRFRRRDFENQARGLRESLGIPDHATVVTCVAAFRREKGHSLLVRAFARVPANIYLVFAGDGELRRAIEADVQAAGLSERVRFLGNVPDVRPIVVASNATVLASTAVETFSIAMLESMSLGVPMIAPRIGGLEEAITHNETGLLFRIGDVEGLARCIATIAEDVTRAAALGRRAAETVCGSFTQQQMVAANERVLRDVLDGQHRLERRAL